MTVVSGKPARATAIRVGKHLKTAVEIILSGFITVSVQKTEETAVGMTHSLLPQPNKLVKTAVRIHLSGFSTIVVNQQSAVEIFPSCP